MKFAPFWLALFLSSSAQTPEELSRRLLVADANILTPYRLTLDEADILMRSEIGEFDVPRAQDGGLDLVFMGMLIPTSHQQAGDAGVVAERRINEMLALIERSEDLALVTSVADARTRFSDGKVGIALALENGAPIGSNPDNIRHFYDRGVRLITLMHSRPNQIGDSSYSQHRPWKGLSPIGREVVREMNRHGMIIDVSHIADDAFYPRLIEELLKRGYTAADIEKILSGSLLRVWGVVERIREL